MNPHSSDHANSQLHCPKPDPQADRPPCPTSLRQLQVSTPMQNAVLYATASCLAVGVSGSGSCGLSEKDLGRTPDSYNALVVTLNFSI